MHELYERVSTRNFQPEDKPDEPILYHTFYLPKRAWMTAALGREPHEVPRFMANKLTDPNRTPEQVAEAWAGWFVANEDYSDIGGPYGTRERAWLQVSIELGVPLDCAIPLRGGRRQVQYLIMACMLREVVTRGWLISCPTDGADEPRVYQMPMHSAHLLRRIEPDSVVVMDVTNRMVPVVVIPEDNTLVLSRAVSVARWHWYRMTAQDCDSVPVSTFRITAGMRQKIPDMALFL